MPKTPDRFPGVREEEGTIYDATVAPTQDGEIRYVGGQGFRVYEEGLERGLGLTEEQHQGLRTLAHFLDDGPGCGFASGAYKEALPVGPFPTSYIWWTSAAKTEKIVELTVTRSGGLPVTEVWEVYDIDGSTVLCTVTDTITYSGPFLASRTRSIV